MPDSLYFSEEMEITSLFNKSHNSYPKTSIDYQHVGRDSRPSFVARIQDEENLVEKARLFFTVDAAILHVNVFYQVHMELGDLLPSRRHWMRKIELPILIRPSYLVTGM